VSRCLGVTAPGGATLTRPTVGALFWPAALRWPGLRLVRCSGRRRYADPAYGWCVVLAGGATLTRPTVGALFWPAALRWPGLRLVRCSGRRR